MNVRIQREPDAFDLPLPAYSTAGAAGMDLYAAVSESLMVPPSGRAHISTGIRVEIPTGYEAQIRPRSGLARDFGIGMVNAPGTLDSDFRGVVGVLLINWGEEPFVVRRGDRIAQMVVAPVARVDWQEVVGEPLPTTPRNEGGFGHTGVSGGEHDLRGA